MQALEFEKDPEIRTSSKTMNQISQEFEDSIVNGSTPNERKSAHSSIATLETKAEIAKRSENVPKESTNNDSKNKVGKF